MEVLAIIPARGGSKRIPNKNLRSLLGKPLIEYSIRAAQTAQTVTRLVVSSEDQKILDLANRLAPGSCHQRSRELAEDDTPMFPVVADVIRRLESEKGYSPDIIVLLQPTSPLRTAVDIDNSVQLLAESDADSVLSVVNVPHNYVPESLMHLRDGLLHHCTDWPENKNLSQLKPSYVARNGSAIYAIRRECVLEKNSLFGDRIYAYQMDKLRSIDIDDEQDWFLTECILRATTTS